MKHRIISYLGGILLLFSLQAQAADTRMRKAPKPLRNEIEWVLHVAIFNNDIKRVQLLIKVGYDVNKQNTYGQMPLHFAVFNNNVKAVQHLLNAGANVNKQNEQGETALHLAARGGCVEAVQQLIKAGADVNKQNHLGDTPQLQATRMNCIETILQLLRADADVNKQNILNWTPLSLAAHKGHLESAQQLLNAGAEGLKAFHKLIANKSFYLSKDKQTTFIKLFIYNQPILTRMENAKGKTAIECARGLDQHLMALLKNTEQYIKQHPEEFRFIDEINDKIQAAEYNVLKKTTPDLFHKIRKRQLGMPFPAKRSRRIQSSIKATPNKSDPKGKQEAKS